MARQLSLAAALLATQVAAHGYINTFTLDGVDYEGFSRWNPSPDPNAIGWSFSTPDEGPELDISSPNFVCRRDSEPSRNYGTIAAGGTASFFWTSDDKVINPNGWAESHRGPILTYIAPCNGDCANVDKTSLRWTKIAESGLVSGPANTQGIWATDVMRENGGINSATIPKSIAPGKYVIRNEIIALHRAHINEPEFYMQCGNIEVTGDGTDDLSGSGVPATELYSRSDSQMFGFSVYDSRDNEWPIPGPALYQSVQSQESQQSQPSPSKESQQSRPSPSQQSQRGRPTGGASCRGE
ncbi:glycosyl hydrolase family 61-domain-containing protein [Chaetomium strumarium]|uniref:lytic cellulose monooxygenase (C4-dehydrogenating) n=1 Tax=Chaetomium strumarium TaxID=1170767 RepID=A0AAJ0GSH7_9PEZI|nr:glycosyl hydrolase family 61-domain-containing protein [Chaetomium strumarium]